MSKNVKGLSGIIKNFARTWKTGLSKGSADVFAELHCPDFVSTLGNVPAEVQDSPSYLGDWASWFEDAWTEHINEWVDEQFAFWRSVFTNLDDAHVELSKRFGRSFKYYCKQHRISLPQQWTRFSPAQIRFEDALESYLFDLAEEICKESSQFPIFWDLAYKTLYITSEAEFYDASVCTSGGRGIVPRDHSDEDDRCLQVVRVATEESIAFPRP